MSVAASGVEFDLGNLLAAGRRWTAAAAAFRRHLARAPGHAEAHFNLANALAAAGEPGAAVESYLACLRISPLYGPAHVNLAQTLRRLGFLDHARALAETAVRILPANPDAHTCRAGLCFDLGAYADAEAAYRAALALAPRHAGALTSLGNVLQATGRLTEARAVQEAACALAPADADAHFNLATTLLAAGEFARGWEEYEWRLRRRTEIARDLGPAWSGEPLAGRTLLLHAEQGLGDTLQFVRYVPLAAARGGRVVIEVQPPLARLLAGVEGVAEVVSQGETLPPHDLQLPLLSLPRVFGTTLETVPAAIPYLPVAPAPVARWRERCPSPPGRRVGLVWAGGGHPEDIGAHLIDRRRSLPPAALAPLGAIGGVAFVSLQKDAAERPAALALLDPMGQVRDFADTAAVVGGLDLVIAVDTAVAHLAGALGREVWLLSRYDGCWRWLAGRADTPWYPAMRLYHQKRPGDWAEVIARVAADLAAWAARPPG